MHTSGRSLLARLPVILALLGMSGLFGAATPVAAAQAAVPSAAQGELSQSEPAGGAFLSAAPGEVRLTFASTLRVEGSAVTVIAPGGVEVNTGPLRIDATRKVVSVSLRTGLPNGLYTVNWVAITDDGHEEEGSFNFGLRVGAAPPTLQADRRALDAGQPLALTGAGFKPDAIVVIAIGEKEEFLDAVRTDGSGRFSRTVQVPAAVEFGPQIITAADSDGAVATFGVQVTGGGPGNLTTYTAARQGARTCSVWSPLFTRNSDGWNSTIVVRNQGSPAVTVEFHMRPLVGGGLINRSISIPQFAARQITGADLGVPEGFRGSLAATATACGQITAVVSHAVADGVVTVESPEVAEANVMVPLAYNDHNGWNSLVVVQNTGRDADATVGVTYRGTEVPSSEANVIVRKDSSVVLDLSTAPKGALTVQLENNSGSQGLVATAYHNGPAGFASASNGVAQALGGRRVSVPVVFRKYNDFTSFIRVVNVKESGAQPKLTFYERDTGERVGTFLSPRALQEGEESTFDLGTLNILADNHVYSAFVEVEPGGGDSLIALAGHANRRRGTEALHPGATLGDTSLTASLVYRGAGGFNSGIQIQNLTGTQGSATVRFKNQSGTTVASTTVTVGGNNSSTVYLPTVTNLPEGFTGVAEINSSMPSSATVFAVRYIGLPQLVASTP